MTTGSAIRHFTLDLDDLEWTGNDLMRPESVVAEPDGSLAMPRLPTFRPPVRGLPMSHWR
jgi:hypothetical protein